MKKTKILSLLLCLSLFCALIVPGTRAYADNEPDSGMKISKTATANADGSYTIMLEAYATGAKVISEITKDVPTDIILVLDQSGSMADPIGAVSFEQYKDESDWWGDTTYHTRNQDYYEYRHNGGNANLWYKDGEKYYSVSVIVDEKISYDNKITNGRNNSTFDGATNYWDNRNNLYAKVDDEYLKVTVTQEDGTEDWWNTYYVYKLPDGTEIARSSGKWTSPTFTGIDGDHLYLASINASNNVYTYTYTDADGVTQTIAGSPSTGADTTFETTLYERVVNTNAGDIRLDALKDALTTFTETVNEKAAGTDGILGTADDVNHRIAVVGYADTDRDYGYNTGVFIGNTLNRYEDAAAEVYSTALQDMSTTNGKSNVAASLNALQASGATRTDYGLIMAKGILDANPVPTGETRNRVVIVFTDGSPTDYNGFQRNVANSAISTANAIKAEGTTVYSIGIFSGADASTAGKEPDKDYEGSGWSANYTEAEMSAACNWFMQKVSSNNGTPRTPSYYLSAGDEVSLNSIFQQISNQIETGGSETTLGSETVVKDIISPYFTLPANATADNITLETYRCTGVDGNGNYTWLNNNSTKGATATIGSTDTADATTTNNQVSVTGFDFAENYVGTVNNNGTVTYRGHKLVISFTVKPRPGFLGGNGVPTNESAGVYENGSATDPVLTFPKPDVNVPLAEPTVNVPDANVYLGAYYSQTVPEDAVKMGATVTIAGYPIDFSKADDPEHPYGLEPWQVKYVNISISAATTGNGGSFENIQEDISYTVTVTVSPKTPGTSGDQSTTDTGTGTIHVFKPELTFQDSEVYYGETVPANNDYSSNYVANSEKWKNGGKYSTGDGVQMLGAKPKLDISYTPDENKLESGKYTKQDVPVLATVNIGTENVNEHTTFVHQDCTGKTCALPEGYHFWIHIQTCQLTITKEGGTDGEPYVFTVYKDGAEYTEATIVGNNSVTIYELPVGAYTIKEDIGWSWRFTGSNGSAATLSAQNPTGSITATNEMRNPYWLNGFSQVVRNIFGISH